MESEDGRRLRKLVRGVKAVWAQFSAVGAGTYAASTAYFMFLSLVPLLALCISVVTLIGADARGVATLFTALLPETLEDFANTLITDAFDRSGIALSVSTLTLLWTASKGARALCASLNAANDETETRSAPVVAIISIGAVLTLVALLAGAVYLVFSDSLLRALAGIMPELELPAESASVLSVAAALVIGTVAIACCYTYLPAGRRRFASQLPGAICAALACGALSFGYRVYVEHFSNFTMLYGSLATVALLMFWIYLVAYILIAGAFLNRLVEQGTEVCSKMDDEKEQIHLVILARQQNDENDEM